MIIWMYWATCTGVKSKQLAYQTEPFGHIFFSIPILACELWFPFLRKTFGIKKTEAPIVIAHHSLACLEMLKQTGNEQWLELARRDAERLVSLSVPDAKGLCWGFPFIWSINCGVIAANQPAATQSAYAFDLFEKLWIITNEEIYFERLLSVAQAMDEEYIDIPPITRYPYYQFGMSAALLSVSQLINSHLLDMANSIIKTFR